jgi:hypothetical protein
MLPRQIFFVMCKMMYWIHLWKEKQFIRGDIRIISYTVTIISESIDVLFKVSPALKLIPMTNVCACKGMAACVTKVGTKWVVSFTFRPLKIRGKGSLCSSRRRLLFQFFIFYETFELNCWSCPSHIVYISDNVVGWRFIADCCVIVNLLYP